GQQRPVKTGFHLDGGPPDADDQAAGLFPWPGAVEGYRDPPRRWRVVGVQPAEPVTQLVFLDPLLGAPAAHAHAAGAKGSDPFPPHLPQLCPCHATTPPCRLMA